MLDTWAPGHVAATAHKSGKRPPPASLACSPFDGEDRWYGVEGRMAEELCR